MTYVMLLLIRSLLTVQVGYYGLPGGLYTEDLKESAHLAENCIVLLIAVHR